VMSQHGAAAAAAATALCCCRQFAYTCSQHC